MSCRERVIPTAPTATAAVTAARPGASGADAPSQGADTTAPAYPAHMARVSVKLTAPAASTLSSPTSGTLGPELWGFVATDGVWYLLGVLNAGSSVAVGGANQGNAFAIDMGRPYDRLHVAGTSSAGTVTAVFVPLEVHR